MFFADDLAVHIIDVRGWHFLSPHPRLATLPRGDCHLRGALADHQQATIRAWHRSEHHEQVTLRIRLYHTQRLDRHALVAHAARHARALVDTAWRCAGANRARGAGAVGLTVRALAAAETVALHDAREAFALRRADDVNLFAL